MNEPLVLKGLDGANPLGFLAALGSLLTARAFCASVCMSWRTAQGGWRPALWYCGHDEKQFIKELDQALRKASMAPFELDKRLPFHQKAFISALRETQQNAAPGNRRTADILTAFGSEVFEEKGMFKDTALRMVRSGDAAGQGLPAYAIAIRRNVIREELHRALFEAWDYRDDDFSFRWDPMEDQRYALRWYDPSPSSNKKYGPQTVRGANALAIEALALIPTFPEGNAVATTAFSRIGGKRDFFTWPIWDRPLSADTVRSVLSMRLLQQETPPRALLTARGIVEVYRCERIAPNQYYKNFGPARPPELHRKLKEQVVVQHHRRMTKEVLALHDPALGQKKASTDIPPPFEGRFPLTDKLIDQARREGRE